MVKKMRGVRSNGSHSAKEADGKRMKEDSPSVVTPFPGVSGSVVSPHSSPHFSDVVRTQGKPPVEHDGQTGCLLHRGVE